MRKDWEIKKLSDVATIFNGNSINAKVKEAKYTNIDSGLPFIATKDVGFDSCIDYENGVVIPFSEKDSFKIAPENTVLICAEGGSAGRKIGFTNQEVCFGNKLFATVPKNGLLSRFAYYYYFSSDFQQNFSTELAGIIGGVSMAKFKQIQIPIPPLPEQKRIVSILDKAFAAIDKAKANAEQNLNNAKELFESYLQGVFNNGHDWKTKELTEIVQERCSLSYGIVQPGDDFTNGLPVIRPVDMKQKYINKTTLKLIDPERAKSYQRTKLVGDELLLCVRGETGMVSLITEELNGANVTRGIVPIAFDTAQLSLSFGYYLFLSPFVKRQIKEKTYGAALMQINIKDLRKLTMPLPDLDSQNEIVKTCDKLLEDTQKLEKIFCKKLDDLEELKKSILHKAFNGEF